MHVLDIATGTGLSAEAALAAVGLTGHVTAADVSPAMAEKARERLGKAPNASVSVEDGQALSFADCSFDAVLCNLGLMFFPDPVRGLSEFRRVLRHGGRVAVSVNTVVERSYNHQINAIIARHMPGSAEAVLAAVGPTGHVIAADVSPAMAEKARERLGKAPNASVFVEDGQALSFADCSFDVILCNLGLMFFPGAGPLRVSSRASPRRSRGRLGEHRGRALLQPSDQRNYSTTYAKFGRGHHSHFRARRSVTTPVSLQ